jgi:tetratricopeptide (TPR) repeat protein
MKKLSLFLITICSFHGFLQSQDLISAKNLTQSQRFEDATDMFKTLLKQEPLNADINYYYGLNILNEYINDTYSNTKVEVAKEAKSIFNGGVQKDSLNPLNQIGLGIIALFEKGDTAQANKYLSKAEMKLPKKAKKYTPRDIEILLQLINAEMYADHPRYKRAYRLCDLAKTIVTENPAMESPDIYITIGDVYLSNMQPSSAIQNYNRALYLDPKNVLLLTKIGNIYIRAKNLNESRNYFLKAKDIDSTFAPLYKGLGEAYSMAGQYNFSKQNYKKFLDLSGNNVPAWVSYINSLFKTGDYAEVISQIEELQKIDNSRNYLNRLAGYSGYDMRPSNYEKAKKFMELFFENTTPEKIIIKDYSYYGRILLKLKQDSLQIDKGLDMLCKAYEMDPSDTKLLDEIINIAYSNDRFDLAAKMLNTKIKSGQATTNDQMFLGKVYYKTKLFGKADTAFTAVTVKEPNNLQAYVWIANTYASMDPDSKEGLAEPKYRMVIKMARTDSVTNSKELFDAYSYMGSYYFLSKYDPNKAESYFWAMVKLDPKNKKWQARGYKSLALLETKKQVYPQAIEFYKKAQAIDPSDADIETAIRDLQKIIEAQRLMKTE